MPKINEKQSTEPAQDKYVCIPIADRHASMKPYLGVDELNAMHAKGYKFLFRQSFGCNESFLYFERMDK
jgi:hypothetical protein